MTYLITFSCYGCRMHGAEGGSVDPAHNGYGAALLDADPARVAFEQRRMDQLPYDLDFSSRSVVLGAIREVCAYRGWRLFAAHVRSTHVHSVVDAEAEPERVMSDFKSYASRKLNLMGVDTPGRRRWARHGSTRWLWKPEHVSAAMQYVLAEQGDPMAVFESHEP